MKKFRIFMVIFMMPIAFAATRQLDGPATAIAAGLTSITVLPASSTLPIGSSTSLVATAFDEFGNNFATSTPLIWQSGNAGVAAVDASGTVSAISLGTTTISATIGSTTGTALVEVTPAPIVSAISVTPASSSAPVGSTTIFQAVARDQYGNQIGASIDWSSSDNSVATINASGTALAIATGSVTITASSSGIQGTSSLTVTPAPYLASITVTPATRLIASGSSQLFTATLLDQFSKPFSATTTWSSSNESVAGINATSGLALALSVGTTTIAAASGNATGTALLRVATSTQTPIITPISAFDVNLGSVVSFVVSATNPNGGTLTYSLGPGAPLGAALGPSSGIFSWTPATPGSYALLVIADDGLVDPASSSVSINVRTLPSGGGGGGGGAGIGGPPPIFHIEAINYDLSITKAQSGRMEKMVTDNLKIVLLVKSQTVSAKTTFSITKATIDSRMETDINKRIIPISGSLFNIVAIDDRGNEVRSFLKPIEVIISGLDLPNDTENLGIYYFDAASNRWNLVTNAQLNQSSQSFSFALDHLTTFGIFIAPGLPNIIMPVARPVQDGPLFPDGSLIRGSDYAIYLLIMQKKYRIKNLAELSRYRGRKINNVSNATVSSYQDYMLIRFAEGELIRGSDMKIYVISGGKKKYVSNLTELRRYAGRKINNVDNVTIAYN